MKKVIVFFVIVIISLPSFAQQQIEPTPGQIFWLEKYGISKLTDQPGRPLDENCKPTFEASTTAIITNLGITSTDGGKSIATNPHRGSTISVLIASQEGFIYQITATIIRTPASWENMLTGGTWVKNQNRNIWNLEYTFQTKNQNDGPPTCKLIRQFNEDEGTTWFVTF